MDLMLIQPDQFTTYSLRKSSRGDDICRILAAAINGVDPREAIKRHISRESGHLVIDNSNYDLDKFNQVFVIGAGKASIPMAFAVNEILGDRITSALVITKDGYHDSIKYPFERKVSIIEANHPIPDHRNLDAAVQLINLTNDLNESDLIIFLLSGGGSSLLMKPSPGISLQDIQTTTSLLLGCGATITEMNTIRKHVDVFKGGGLAKFFSPASVVSLILSDVVGNSPDVIASGPTVADPTTFNDAWMVLNKYQLLDEVSLHIKVHISAGMRGEMPETLKPGDPILKKVSNFIVGNNRAAASSAFDMALALGFNAKLLTTSLQGEASHMGQIIFAKAKSLFLPPSSFERPACFIAGGETTVTLKGSGKGGRNQELALGAVSSLNSSDQWILASLATDGGDGPTDAAGAVATNLTYSRGLTLGIDPQIYLDRNDSYHYFEALGDLIKTGPSLTNVNDLVFIFGL